MPPASTSMVSPGTPRPLSLMLSPTWIVLWEITREGGRRVAMGVAVGSSATTGVLAGALSLTAAAATINFRGALAVTNEPSANNVCTVTL